jgi:hypothetical protein
MLVMSEEDDKPAEPQVPNAWADDAKQSVKRWSDDARSDDPDATTVFAPLEAGIGDGKAFFFLFGFRMAAAMDRKMLEMELAHIDDDIEVLRKAGYTVVVDKQATRKDFLAMVKMEYPGAEKLVPAGFYWSAHGNKDGSVQACDGELITPSDLDGVETPSGMRLAIFAACYVAARSKTWKTALGGHPLVVGWGRPVTIQRAVEFLEPSPDTETDLDDLIRRWLLVDRPLPGGESESRYSPSLDAAAQGRIENLGPRVENLAEMIGGKWREQENFMELLVPLHDERTQICRVFIIDSDQPFAEGEPMLGVESDVGELSEVVDASMLLGGLPSQSYARVALVQSDTESPTIVTQGFLPLARVRDQDLAALVYQVADWGDELEKRIFGGDMR